MADIFDPTLDDVDVEISDNKVFKGEDINLNKLDPTLSRLLVGVGWRLNAFDADSLDLDVSCFMLNKDDKTRVNEDFVFYNNLTGTDDAIIHNGDNLIGAGDGDDETISIDLNKIHFDIIRVMFVLSIYKGEEKEQSMKNVRDPYIRVMNADNGQELLRYEVSEDVEECTDTAVFVASLERMGPKWHFKPLGDGVDGGIEKVAQGYDIIVQTG